jgi:hypothetical protein
MKNYLALLILTVIAMYVYPQASPSSCATTTLPIIYINPNPQIGGFGEIGIVSSVINNNAGLTQNPALLSRNKKIAGIITNLSTWSNYNPETYLGNIGIYYSIDNTNTFAYSFDYFRIGEVQFTDHSWISKPYQYYHSLRYAHTFFKELSAGIGVKIIKSDLAPNIAPSFYTFSMDLGIDYRKQFHVSEKSVIRLDLGLSAQDIGPKIGYVQNQKQDNIPIKIGGATMMTFFYRINEETSVSFDLAYQLEKIVVKTPNIYDTYSQGWLDEIEKSKNLNLTSQYGYFGSFITSTENRVIKSSSFINKFGTELRLNIKENILLSLRGGHLEEFESKGGDGYYTLGAGIGVHGFRFDYSRLLIQTKNISAFSLSFEINLTNRKVRFTEN